MNPLLLVPMGIGGITIVMLGVGFCKTGLFWGEFG